MNRITLDYECLSAHPGRVTISEATQLIKASVERLRVAILRQQAATEALNRTNEEFRATFFDSATSRSA